MTGGSGRKFLISFALGQLKSYRKSGFCNKLSTKLGRGWTITSIDQKNDFPLDGNLKEHTEKSESKDNIEEEDDYFDDHSGSFSIISSSSDDNDGTVNSCGFTYELAILLCKEKHGTTIFFFFFQIIANLTFSVELRNQFKDDR